jgi:cytochrome c biogenesis protein
MRSAWKFFSSVRLAIVLIILITLASILGTLIPQGRSAAEYTARYGGLAGPLAALQLTNLYRSGWYLALLLLFAVNIVVCTVSRFGPKRRRAFRSGPKTAADIIAVSSMRPNARLRLPLGLPAAREAVAARLVARRYRLSESAGDGKIHILARKRRLGWFGSDIVHVGLLVIIAGGLASGLFGRRADLALTEGQTAEVPQAAFEVRLDKFETEYYPGGAVKDWKSTVTIVKDSAPVLTRVVEVNKPLTYRGVSFYQQRYGWDWSVSRLILEVKRSGDTEPARTVSLKVGERVAVEGAEALHVAVRRFVPDFVIGDGNRVQSRSNEPGNPAALVEAWIGEERIFAGWVFAKFPDFGQGHGAQASPGQKAGGQSEAPELAVVLKDFAAAPFSVLEAASDPGANLIWLGCALVMAGLFLAFYWPPREIRVVLEEAGGRVELAAGGHAPKSREAFRSEFEGIFKTIRRPE